MQSTVEMWDWEAAPVYGHLATKKSYSPPHNNSATIDTVYLPCFFFLKPKYKFIDFNWHLASNFSSLVLFFANNCDFLIP